MKFATNCILFLKSFRAQEQRIQWQIKSDEGLTLETSLP
mgnify:CR=1 FL=1